MYNKFKQLYFFIMTVLLIIIVCLKYKTYTEEKEYEKIRESTIITSYLLSRNEQYLEPVLLKEEIIIEEETIEETPKFEYTPELSIDYEKMKKINDDYVCWINIPGTKISYPVTQYYNNDFYLHRAFETKAESYAGTIFIDSFAKNGLEEDNVVIYGHNMKNGSMFGTLKKLKNKDTFENSKYIEIYAKDYVYVYEIFSVRDVSSDINSLNYKLNNFDIKEYIENAKNQSIQYRDPSVYTKMISLSTCVGDYSRRLLVTAMRLN